MNIGRREEDSLERGEDKCEEEEGEGVEAGHQYAQVCHGIRVVGVGRERERERNANAPKPISVSAAALLIVSASQICTLV